MIAPLKTIQVGSLGLAIRRYADGRYGFDYTPPGGARIQVRKKELPDAEKEARVLMGAATAGKVSKLDLDVKQYAEFLIYQAARRAKIDVPELVAKFIETKRSKGRSEWHVRTLKGDLGLFAKHFTGPIDELTRQEVEQWITSRQAGPRRWNNLLASIVALHRFARRERLLGAELTPVELIERHFHRPAVETYSLAEFQALLAAASEEWLPALVFGGLCGLRPEEYRPDPRFGKIGLRWENVLWDKGTIDVPAVASKVRRRRFAVLCEAAAAFLTPYRERRGPVLPEIRLTKYTAALAGAAGVAWKPNGLRHSYASYRLALTHDAAALALEMGNSPAMIFNNYLDLKHADEGAAWFAISPESIKSTKPAPDSVRVNQGDSTASA